MPFRENHRTALPEPCRERSSCPRQSGQIQWQGCTFRFSLLNLEPDDRLQTIDSRFLVLGFQFPVPGSRFLVLNSTAAPAHSLLPDRAAGMLKSPACR